VRIARLNANDQDIKIAKVFRCVARDVVLSGKMSRTGSTMVETYFLVGASLSPYKINQGYCLAAGYMC
jgi:hypothetical protein